MEQGEDRGRTVYICEHCGKTSFDPDIIVHERECDGSETPQEKFDIGDEVTFSDFGRERLSPVPDITMEVIGFSDEHDHCVEVDRVGGSRTYAMAYLKPVGDGAGNPGDSSG